MAVIWREKAPLEWSSGKAVAALWKPGCLDWLDHSLFREVLRGYPHAVT